MGVYGKRKNSEGGRKKKRENERVEWETDMKRLKDKIFSVPFFGRHIYPTICATRHTITLCHPALMLYDFASGFCFSNKVWM